VTTFKVGVYFVILLVLVALFAPQIATADPNFIPRGSQRLGPNAEQWFGTDQAGRDLFSRVIFGARTSITIGIATALISTIIGAAVGVVAGWRGGWSDAVLMRLTEVFFVIPGILIAGSLVVIFDRSPVTIVAILSLVGWPVIARLTRAEVVRVKEMDFIEAARASGSSGLRTVFRHVIPHVLPAVGVLSVTAVGTAIMAESTLSFLGLGIAEPTSSWGLMIASGQRFLTSDPHIVVFPAFAVFFTVLAFVLVGIGIRSALRLDAR
jgi:ABC-type dipeptide/oligopeptide/nickel transport system permease subunit